MTFTHRDISTQAYMLNKGGSRARMAILRQLVAFSHDPGRPPSRALTDWRAARKWGLHDWQAAYCTLSQGMNGRDPVWVTHCGPYFRDESDANHRQGRERGGYYTSSDCDERAIGIVARLPHGRFIAGYRWTSNDERVYFGQVFTDEDEAHSSALEHARVFAEIQMADNERFEAMTLAELDVEDKLSEVQQAFALRHRSKFGGADRVREGIEALRKAREECREATAAYERG